MPPCLEKDGEPFAALSLAGTVVQFAEFATKVAEGSHETLQSAEGLTIEHEQFRALTDGLQEFCDELQKPISEDQLASREEKCLKSLAEECAAECRHLQDVLNELRVKEGGKRWNSLVAAVKAIGKENAMLEIQNNLEGFQNTIGLQLGQILENKQSNVQTTIREMKQSNEQLDAQHTGQITEVTRKLNHIRDYGASKDEFAQLHSDLVHILTIGRNVVVEQKVLKSLLFRQMKFRHEEIHESHRHTFDWIFESESDTANQTYQRPKVHFVEWLRNSGSAQSIYWLGGEAGSGKSTLMKYLCSHERVQTELQAWTRDGPLVVASFFFSGSGTELQKSQEGLLRSLLFEVLRQCPKIISKVTELKWTCAVRDPWSRSEEQEPWTLSEMMQVFSLLEDEHIGSKFCFFIDGLDEYDGDPSDLIEVIRKLARSSNVKLCVSSRPWTEFKKAFDVEGRALHLHELIRNDIGIYVRDKLEQHARFIQKDSRDITFHELVVEISERAQGIFLWVLLVIDSLKRESAHADSTEILQQRLRLLPTDPEGLFSHMLGPVDPIYDSQMGQTFLIAMAAGEPLPLMLYHTLDELQTDPNVALRAKSYTRQEWKARGVELSKDAKRLVSTKESDMRVRLKAQSRGLLEVQTSFLHSKRASTLRVGFLHRIVRNYLEKPEIAENLIRLANTAESSSSEFIPEVALCHCLLAGIKMLPPGEPGDQSADEVLEFVDDLLWYAYKAEASTNAAQEDVLDELSKTLSIMFPPESSLSLGKKSHPIFQPLHPKLLEKYSCASLIELCVQRGLSKYVSLKVSPELVAERFGQPLLFHALLPKKCPKHGLVKTYGMVPLLLENGADPNSAVVPTGSIWSAFLSGHIVDRGGIYTTLPKVELVEQLLEANANPDVKVKRLSVFGRLINGSFVDALWDQRLCLLQSFVRHGASPNKKYKNGTIWQERLRALYTAENKTGSSQQFEEVKLLLQAKANVNARVWKEGTTCTNSKGQKAYRANFQTVKEAIEKIFDSRQAAELLQVADEMRDRGMLARLKRSLQMPFEGLATEILVRQNSLPLFDNTGSLVTDGLQCLSHGHGAESPTVPPSEASFHTAQTSGSVFSIGGFSTIFANAPEPSLWRSYLRRNNLIPRALYEQNWSGRGQHAEFSRGEQLPFLDIDFLGQAGTARVDAVTCQRIRLARKTIRCRKPQSREKMAQEIAHLQRLRHAHIIRIIGTYVVHPCNDLHILLYPVAQYNLQSFMDAIQDLSADNEVHTESQQEASIMFVREAIRSLVYFFRCLTSTLSYLHQQEGQVTKHMDIKPANILVRDMSKSTIRHPTRFKVYLADFGIARSYPSASDAETDSPTSCTKFYAAPEIHATDTPRGLKADVFSLGCVFSEILCTYISPARRNDLADIRESNTLDSSFQANSEEIKRYLQDIEENSPATYCMEARCYCRVHASACIRMLDADPERRPSADALMQELVILDQSQTVCCNRGQDELEDAVQTSIQGSAAGETPTERDYKEGRNSMDINGQLHTSNCSNSTPGSIAIPTGNSVMIQHDAAGLNSLPQVVEAVNNTQLPPLRIQAWNSPLRQSLGFNRNYCLTLSSTPSHTCEVNQPSPGIEDANLGVISEQSTSDLMISTGSTVGS